MLKRGMQNSPVYQRRYLQQSRRGDGIFYFILALLVCAVFAFRIYWTNNFGGVDVSGSSMYTTLSSGERLIMKYSDGSNAKRGDIIVLYVGDYEECKNAGVDRVIKRLIAIEGDKLYCVDGQIYIQYANTEGFVPLDEDYAHYTNKEKYDFGEYVVGAGEIFFLGDNRNISVDSRYMEKDEYGNSWSHLQGLYKRSDIEGIVPNWAVNNKKVLGKIFFTVPEWVEKNIKKLFSKG